MDWTRQDRLHRERLEKMSPSAGRVNMAALANGLAAGQAAREMPGLAAYGVLRAIQKGHAFEVRQHNRHHAVWLAARLARASDDGAKDGLGGGPDSAADEEHVPDLKDRIIVSDSAGAIYGDGRAAHGEVRADRGRKPNRGSDHWSDGEVRPAEQVLSAEDLKHILSMQLRQRFF